MITERDRAKTLALGQPVPAARTEGLVTTSTDDDVLVYDQERHHIHHLNHTAAVIWRLCDGRRSVEQLARAASSQEAEPINADTVRLAIDKLAGANLLVAAVPDSIRLSTQSRRSFMKRAAVAGAVAIPAVVSMTAPAAAAVSVCGLSCTCQSECKGDPSHNSCPQCNYKVGNSGDAICCNPGGSGKGVPCVGTRVPCDSPTSPPSGIRKNSVMAPQSQTTESTQPPAPQATQPPAPQATQLVVDQQPTDQSQGANGDQSQGGGGAPADAPSPTPTDTPPPPPPPMIPTMPQMQTNNAAANSNGSVSNPGTTGNATDVPNPSGNGG